MLFLALANSGPYAVNFREEELSDRIVRWMGKHQDPVRSHVGEAVYSAKIKVPTVNFLFRTKAIYEGRVGATAFNTLIHDFQQKIWEHLQQTRSDHLVDNTLRRLLAQVSVKSGPSFLEEGAL